MSTSDPAPSARASLLARLASEGWAIVDLAERARAQLVQPWLLVDGLLGLGPQLTEVQPIRPVPHACLFAASTGVAPLHTDSQQWRGRPPDLQLTACLRPSADGGESVLVDGFAIAERVRSESPSVYDALLRQPRCMPFVFGPVFGPTLARRADRYVFTHTPRPVVGDPIAAALLAVVRDHPATVVRIERDQALLVDNHRMLHGRRAFADPDRELLRVLAWLDRPLGARPVWADVADRVHTELAAALADRSDGVRRAFGLDTSQLSPLDAAVMAMLSGAPPGALARRLGVPEAALYRHRDGRVVVAGATDPDDACLRALEDLAVRP